MWSLWRRCKRRRQHRSAPLSAHARLSRCACANGAWIGLLMRMRGLVSFCCGCCYNLVGVAVAFSLPKNGPYLDAIEGVQNGVAAVAKSLPQNGDHMWFYIQNTTTAAMGRTAHRACIFGSVAVSFSLPFGGGVFATVFIVNCIANTTSGLYQIDNESYSISSIFVANISDGRR